MFYFVTIPTKYSTRVPGTGYDNKFLTVFRRGLGCNSVGLYTGCFVLRFPDRVFQKFVAMNFVVGMAPRLLRHQLKTRTSKGPKK